MWKYFMSKNGQICKLEDGTSMPKSKRIFSLALEAIINPISEEIRFKNVIVQPICKGGLKMINIDCMINSIRIIWIKRLNNPYEANPRN